MNWRQIRDAVLSALLGVTYAWIVWSALTYPVWLR